MLSSEQSGTYLDPNALEELTNVYLEIASSSNVKGTAAANANTTPNAISSAVTASVAQPGIIEFSAVTDSPQQSAKLANADATAFQSAVTTQSASQAATRIAALQRRASALQHAIAKLPGNDPARTGDAAELAALQQDMADVTATPGNTTELIQNAVAPTSASSPKPLRDAMIAAILALALTPSVVLLIAQVRSRFESAEDASEALQLPIISLVPQCDDPVDAAAESMRLIDIFTRMTVAPERDTSAPVILFVSASPGDGKTFVTSALFATLTNDHRQSIFIDADLHQRTLSVNLRSEASSASSTGLAEVLTDPSRIDGLISELTDSGDSDSSADGAKLVFAGSTSGNPTEMLSSPGLERLMTSLTALQRPIYIDSPAMLPTSDALPLSRFASAVFIVVNASRTRRHDALEAVRRMRSIGAPIYGMIYNGAAKRTSYGYRNYYGTREVDSLQQSDVSSDQPA